MASKRLRDTVGIDPDRVVSAALEAALGEVEQPHKKRHPGRVLVAGAALAAAATVGQRRMPRMARLPLRMGLQKLGDMTRVEELADALHDRADALHDRLVGHDDDDFDDAELADDEDFDEDDEGDLPDDEAEDDFDDEDDDEDVDGDDGFDDGPEEDDGPRDEGDGEEPEPDDDDFDDSEEDPADEEPEEELPEDEAPDDEESEPEDEEESEPEDDEEEEDDDEEVAARSRLDLGVSSNGDAGPARDRVPDLFEALRTGSRRAPVMQRGTRRVDPADRPPTPDSDRHRDDRRGSSRKSKPKTARA